MPNQWVQIGTSSAEGGENESLCALYTDIHPPSGPEWGISGENSEEVTRHILCCNDPEDFENEEREDIMHSIPSDILNRPPMLEDALGEDFMVDGEDEEEEDEEKDGEEGGGVVDNGTDAGDDGQNDNSNNSNPEEANSPTSDNTAINDPQTIPEVHVPSHGADQNQVSKFFQTVWFGPNLYSGTTYQEGMDFCASEAGGRIVCPYEAYCPDGPGTPPLFGIRGSEDVALWAPMLWDTGENSDNWVGVGPQNPCQEMEGGGTRAENSLGHIMCCIAEDGSGEVSSSGSNADADAAATTPAEVTVEPTGGLVDQFVVVDLFHPVWYGPESQWRGSTYEEGLSFCKNEGLNICPYSVYCPDGPGEAPLLGIRGVDDVELWSPMAVEPPSSGYKSSWVSVGPIDPCMHANDGSFQDNSSVMSYIMCCNDNVLRENALPPPDAGSGSNQAGDNQSENAVFDTTGLEEVLDEFSLKVLNTWNPLWFSREHGWDGSTHEHAKEFCGSIFRDGGLCPFPAVCPDGEQKAPYQHNLPKMNGEQWVPVAQPPNTWVLVGQEEGEDSSNICEEYITLHGKQAKFGLTGKQTELKENILCCRPVNMEDPQK